MLNMYIIIYMNKSKSLHIYDEDILIFSDLVHSHEDREGAKASGCAARWCGRCYGAHRELQLGRSLPEQERLSAKAEIKI